MKNLLLIFSFILCYSVTTCAQVWDDVSKGMWPKEFQEVSITSSVDSSPQKAILYKSTKGIGQPLIVSLHTWSGDYTQENPLTEEILIRDCNLIQPDFRGPNNRPEACGSDLVISDIEDAIAYAIESTGADRSQVHIVGVSGGGYAALLCYMRLQFRVKSFSAWVPISDLEAWYWESVGRNQHYSIDILQSTSSSFELNITEAHKRSPLYLPYPTALREGSSLHIYTGIHDGYKGSVPITHSINMYNKIVKEKYPDNESILISQEDVLELVVKRCFPNAGQENIGTRKLHYHKIATDVEIVVFEGGHEQITDQAIGLIPVSDQVRRDKVTFLTLGDSNAATKYGWANQLEMILPYSVIVNRSMSGKCVGISNLQNDNLNSLLTIDTTLQSIKNDVDYIIVGLGTNDAKRDYAASRGEYPNNMRKFIKKIKESELYHRCTPKIIILSCPPLDENKAETKYGGAEKRLKEFNKALAKIAREEGGVFIDMDQLFKSSFGLLQPKTSITKDGVHLTPKSARIVAEAIVGIIENE